MESVPGTFLFVLRLTTLRNTEETDTGTPGPGCQVLADLPLFLLLPEGFSD